MRTYVRMVVCVHLPRFELVVAAGEESAARQALAGRALAVAPQARLRAARGGGLGGRRGLRRDARDGARRGARPLPRAGARAADPVSGGRGLGGARCARWSRSARPSSRRGPGLAYFEADGLRGLHGADAGDDRRRPARARARPARMGARADALLRAGGRAGGALAPAARAGRRRGPRAGSPAGRSGCSASARRPKALVEPLGRLGVRTLGELERARPRSARRPLRRGRARSPTGSPAARTSPLRPRRVEERLEESMDVGDASSGAGAGARARACWCDRLLARPERRGRTLRAVTLSARLLAGGGWRERVVFRQALVRPRAHPAGAVAAPGAAARPRRGAARWPSSASARRPASRARCSTRTAPTARGAAARGDRADARRGRAGRGAAGVCVDPDSRVPERRVVLAPIPE